MTTPSPADGLRECLALLEKATTGEWFAQQAHKYTHLRAIGDKHGNPYVMEGGYRHPVRTADDARAIAAAVNFLRDHGPALATALRLREGCERLVREWRSIANENSELAAKPDNSDARRDWHYATSQQADDCADDLARILEEGK